MNRLNKVIALASLIVMANIGLASTWPIIGTRHWRPSAAAVIDWLFENYGPDVAAPFGTFYMVRQAGVGGGTYTNGPASGTLDGNFRGGVLAPNGKVILVPYNSNYVGIYDPVVGSIDTNLTKLLHPIINKF